MGTRASSVLTLQSHHAVSLTTLTAASCCNVATCTCMVLEGKNDFSRHKFKGIGLPLCDVQPSPSILVWAYGMWLMVMIKIDSSMTCMRRISTFTIYCSLFQLGYVVHVSQLERERENPMIEGRRGRERGSEGKTVRIIEKKEKEGGGRLIW